MVQYQKSFNLSGEGSSTGIVFIVMNLGQIASFPFCGFFADGYGRRVCIFIGCLVTVIGAIIQTLVVRKSAFIGGPFLLGIFPPPILQDLLTSDILQVLDLQSLLPPDRHTQLS
jgi:MFS family permease